MARSAACILLGLALALAACGDRKAGENASVEPAALAIPSPLPAPIQAALDDPRRAMHRGGQNRYMKRRWQQSSQDGDDDLAQSTPQSAGLPGFRFRTGRGESLS